MRPILAIAALFFVTFLVPSVYASEWEATLLGLKLSLPDGPGWSSFKSSQPDARVARQNTGTGSMFVVAARAIPDKFRAELVANPNSTEQILKSIVDGATSSEHAAKASPPQKFTLDGIPAYRLTLPPVTKDGRSAYSEHVFWVHHYHLFSLNLVSTSGPVAQNPDLTAVVQSIRLAKP